MWGLALFVLLRYGLLSLMAYEFFMNIARNLLHTIDFSVWYGHPALVGSLLLIGVGGYAFYLSLAGRAIFTDRVLDEARA